MSCSLLDAPHKKHASVFLGVDGKKDNYNFRCLNEIPFTSSPLILQMCSTKGCFVRIDTPLMLTIILCSLAATIRFFFGSRDVVQNGLGGGWAISRNSGHR